MWRRITIVSIPIRNSPDDAGSGTTALLGKPAVAAECARWGGLAEVGSPRVVFGLTDDARVDRVAVGDAHGAHVVSPNDVIRGVNDSIVVVIARQNERCDLQPARAFQEVPSSIVAIIVRVQPAATATNAGRMGGFGHPLNLATALDFDSAGRPAAILARLGNIYNSAD